MSNTELSASFNDAFDEDIEDVEAEDIEVDETEAETPENPEPEAPQAEETPEPLEPPEYFTAEQKEAFKQIQDRAVQEAFLLSHQSPKPGRAMLFLQSSRHQHEQEFL